jgi:hypothetical protein
MLHSFPDVPLTEDFPSHRRAALPTIKQVDCRAARGNRRRFAKGVATPAEEPLKWFLRRGDIHSPHKGLRNADRENSHFIRVLISNRYPANKVQEPRSSHNTPLLRSPNTPYAGLASTFFWVTGSRPKWWYHSACGERPLQDRQSVHSETFPQSGQTPQ